MLTVTHRITVRESKCTHSLVMDLSVAVIDCNPPEIWCKCHKCGEDGFFNVDDKRIQKEVLK